MILLLLRVRLMKTFSCMFPVRGIIIYGGVLVPCFNIAPTHYVSNEKVLGSSLEVISELTPKPTPKPTPEPTPKPTPKPTPGR